MTKRRSRQPTARWAQLPHLGPHDSAPWARGWHPRARHRSRGGSTTCLGNLRSCKLVAHLERICGVAIVIYSLTGGASVVWCERADMVAERGSERKMHTTVASRPRAPPRRPDLAAPTRARTRNVACKAGQVIVDAGSGTRRALARHPAMQASRDALMCLSCLCALTPVPCRRRVPPRTGAE